MIRRSLDRDWIGDAESKGILTAEEAKLVRETEELIFRVISVDDFPPEVVTGRVADKTGAGTPQSGELGEQPGESQPADAEAEDRRGKGGGVQAAE